MFVWSDLNGDGRAQPNEVTLVKKQVRGITVMPDLSYLASYVDGEAVRYAPKQFTDAGAPVYDLAAGQTLVQGGADGDVLRRRTDVADRRRLDGADGGAEAVRAAVGRRGVPRRSEMVLSQPVAGPARLARSAAAGSAG